MGNLSQLRPANGSTRAKKRVGRGVGSGLGKTAGRGQKGQKARSGGSVRPGFEGGQMPLHRRLPKGGFTNIFRVEYATINVRSLARAKSGTVIDLAYLISEGLIPSNSTKVKLLGSGNLDARIIVRVDKASAGAIEKVKAAGGVVEVIGG
ncbi:MAG: 50S ribosomal protein L15 [Myxococcales bacterium]|nr:50S ribosomal protein L15 [Myxococcales bacterium]